MRPIVESMEIYHIHMKLMPCIFCLRFDRDITRRLSGLSKRNIQKLEYVYRQYPMRV